MILLVVAALAAASPPLQPASQPQVQLAEAAHALQAGRLDQARVMIGRAVADGATGSQVDRLLADLAFAKGDDQRALAAYQILFAHSPADPLVAERAGIAALRLGKLEIAVGLLDRATALPGASWRAWNARAAVADMRQDWEAADRAYARAALLSPDRAEIANNIGWSLLLRGDWETAAAELERAASADPSSIRIANNLEFARAAMSADLPSRVRNESAEAWSARLNDAGVAAAARGDKTRAIAAFVQAIETRSQYYARAVNNLALVEAQQ